MKKLTLFINFALKHEKKFAFLICLLAIFIFYANVINGPFFFDDEFLIQRNVFLRGWGNFLEIFSSNLNAGAGKIGNFYRPMQNSFYTVTFNLFGENPAPFHIANIFLHAINTFFVFLILRKIFKFEFLVSILGTLIWGLHPAHTQAVSYISGTADLLVAFFIFLGFLSYSKGGRYLVLSFLSFCLAILSRENAVVFPGIIFLYEAFLFLKNKEKPKKENIIFFILIISLTCLYIYSRFTFLNFKNSFNFWDEENIYTENLWVRLLSFVSIIPEYLKLIFFPKDLYYEKEFVAFAAIAIQNILGFLVIIVFAIGFIFSIRKEKVFAFGVLWFFGCLIPVSGIVPVNALYLEHWIYIPLVGLIIIYSSLFNKEKAKKYLAVFSLIVIFVFGIRVFLRNNEWANPKLFYLNEISHNPSARILNNLGMIYDEEGDFDKAIETYEKSLELSKSYPNTFHNLANSYLKKGDLNNAVINLYNALFVDPNFIYSHAKLAEIFEKNNMQNQSNLHKQEIMKIQNGVQISREEIQELANKIIKQK